MIDLEAYLYEKVKPIMEKWNEKGIYAISFFVYSNSANTYKTYQNVSEFAISYNTEKDFEQSLNSKNASSPTEARWNYAFWRQDTTYIIDSHDEDSEGIKILFLWYEENGIENIGFEDDDRDKMYDENMFYIGKGPVGYYELLTAVSNVARKLQLESFILKKFGKIPIIVHQLEDCWYVEEATANANPNGEASEFIEALREDYLPNGEQNNSYMSVYMESLKKLFPNVEQKNGDASAYIEAIMKSLPNIELKNGELDVEEYKKAINEMFLKLK